MGESGPHGDRSENDDVGRVVEGVCFGDAVHEQRRLIASVHGRADPEEIVGHRAEAALGSTKVRLLRAGRSRSAAKRVRLESAQVRGGLELDQRDKHIQNGDGGQKNQSDGSPSRLSAPTLEES